MARRLRRPPHRNGYTAVLDWVARARAGQPHISDPEAIHAANAAGLATYGAGRPEEIRTLLRDGQHAVLTLVDALNDAELDLPALVSATGERRTVEQVLTTLLEAHTRSHLDSIRAAVAARSLSV